MNQRELEEIEEVPREMYFIIPRRNNELLTDTTALKMLNELHRSKTINTLLLKYEERYPAVERYCEENETRKIDIELILDNSEIIREATKSKERRRFAYISSSETIGSLNNVVEELSERGFYLETRIAISS